MILYHIFWRFESCKYWIRSILRYPLFFFNIFFLSFFFFSFPKLTLGDWNRCQHLWVSNTFMDLFLSSPEGTEDTFLCFFWGLGWENILSAKATPSTRSNLSVVWDKDIECLRLRHSGSSLAPQKVQQREGGQPQLGVLTSLLPALVCWGGPCTSQRKEDGRLSASPCLTQSWLASYALALPHSHEVIRNPSLRWSGCLSSYWSQDLISPPTSQFPPQSPFLI